MPLPIASRHAIWEYALEKAGRPSWPKVIGAVIGLFVGAWLGRSPDGAWLGTAIGGLLGAVSGWTTEVAIRLWQAPAHVAAREYDILSGAYGRLQTEAAALKRQIAKLEHGLTEKMDALLKVNAMGKSVLAEVPTVQTYDAWKIKVDAYAASVDRLAPEQAAKDLLQN